jgi:hypothetical protein
MNFRFFALTLTSVCVASSFAGQLSNRSQVDSLLGGMSVTETFEGYNISDGSAVAGIQGPLTAPMYGLIGGATYSSGNNSFQWNGRGWYGQASRDIIANANTMTITYASASRAVGMDISGYEFYSDNGSVSFYGASGLLGTVSLTTNGDGSATFVGWADAGGITSAVVTDTYWGWGLIVDNNQYQATPEPAPLAALGFGALGMFVRRRKK